MLLALVVTTSGCRVGADDEMVAPARTVTAAPMPQATIAPTSVPVGDGEVSRSVAVWAQDSTLRFGPEQVSLFPRRIESLVVVQGGVFLLDQGALWFTDLVRVRDTGLRDVTEVAADSDADTLLVTRSTAPGQTERLAYELENGVATDVAEVRPATVADLRGTPAQVSVRPAADAAASLSAVPPRSARLGPGEYGVLDEAEGELVAFASATGARIPLKGVVGTGFELVRWTSGSTFYGVAEKAGRPVAVISCDLDDRRCRSLGDVVPDLPLVFETGS